MSDALKKTPLGRSYREISKTLDGLDLLSQDDKIEALATALQKALHIIEWTALFGAAVSQHNAAVMAKLERHTTAGTLLAKEFAPLRQIKTQMIDPTFHDVAAFCRDFEQDARRKYLPAGVNPKDDKAVLAHCRKLSRNGIYDTQPASHSN